MLYAVRGDPDTHALEHLGRPYLPMRARRDPGGLREHILFKSCGEVWQVGLLLQRGRSTYARSIS